MSVEIRLFNQVKDQESIESFLLNRQHAHGLDSPKNKEWFWWKFFKSPNGPAIMSCAYDGEQIVGCNSYGTYLMQVAGRNLNAIITYEIFVDSRYQRQGIFKKLIRLSEETGIANGIDLMFSVPNENSLQGFISRGWKYLDNFISYWIRPVFSYRFFRHLGDLRKPFKPNKSPETENSFDFENLSTNIYSSQLHGYWTKDYLHWRFNMLPQAEYSFIKEKDYDSIARVGHRGKLKELQILYVNFKKGDVSKHDFRSLIANFKKKLKPDIISFPISTEHPLNSKMSFFGFYKFKSATNFTYKIISPDIDEMDVRFSLCGLDFHTY